MDAVRGVAALIVVFHHALLILPGAGENRIALRTSGFHSPFAWIYLTPLRLLVAGPAAVFMFFVLSGFVLTISLGEGGRESYASFLTKRVARIWLPFATVVSVSAILAWLMGGQPLAEGASQWMAETWADQPYPGMFVKHLMMLGTISSLDNPMWSLVHEMRISLIFPLMFLLIRWNIWIGWLGTIVLFWLAIELQIFAPIQPVVRSLLTTVCYLPLFMMGISLALHQEQVFEWLGRRGRLFYCACWLVAVGGLAYAPVVTSIIARFHDGIILLFNGAAATMVIALVAIDGHTKRLLMKPVPQWLGQISYSLYLVHVVVFATVLRALDKEPLWIVIPIAIVISFLVAAVNQRFVEKPSAVLGRIGASRFGRPRFARSHAVAGLAPPISVKAPASLEGKDARSPAHDQL